MSKTKNKEAPKKKVGKDKTAPKRPTSAFFYYQAERRATIKAEKPEMQNKEYISVSNFKSDTFRQWLKNGEISQMTPRRSSEQWSR